MADTDYDIRILIEQCAKRDTESSKKLYEMLVDKVYTYVRSRTKTHEDATDITQETFIDLFRALPSFTYHSRAQFYAYVFVITKRKLARYYTHAKRDGNEPMVFDEEHMAPSDEDVSHDMKRDILRALATLEEHTREIVILHHWSRYTFGEIAELLGMNESAVRVRHHRALATLGTRLKE
jgi:RNA polymerase sigma factor (sigma-70 family)